MEIIESETKKKKKLATVMSRFLSRLCPLPDSEVEHAAHSHSRRPALSSAWSFGTGMHWFEQKSDCFLYLFDCHIGHLWKGSSVKKKT